MLRVAAGAHLPTPWLFEPAKCPEDRADYCLGCSFLPNYKHQVLVSTLKWSGARPWNYGFDQYTFNKHYEALTNLLTLTPPRCGNTPR